MTNQPPPAQQQERAGREALARLERGAAIMQAAGESGAGHRAWWSNGECAWIDDRILDVLMREGWIEQGGYRGDMFAFWWLSDAGRAALAALGTRDAEADNDS